MNLKPDDLIKLKCAVEILENPSFTARVISVLGSPIESAFTKLPEKWTDVVQESTRAGLKAALKVAIATMDENFRRNPSNLLHQSLCGISGFCGGFLGMASLPLEIPASTVIILRSILDIARNEGEDIKTPNSQLACIEVFALGGKGESDNNYYSVRYALAKSVSEASKYIAEKGIIEEGSPVLVRFITEIASQYGITVSEKFAVQIVPIIGAICGGTINMLFITHFQNMAKGHFIVRRLERIYGEEIIRTQYNNLRNNKYSKS